MIDKKRDEKTLKREGKGIKNGNKKMYNAKCIF